MAKKKAKAKVKRVKVVKVVTAAPDNHLVDLQMEIEGSLPVDQLPVEPLEATHENSWLAWIKKTLRSL
jgi:hypothetical protein